MLRRSMWGATESSAEPLIVPLDIASPVPIFDNPTPTKVTTLSNGIKVASSDLPSAATTVGVYVNTGSKYESVPGTAHVLQHMAFKSSTARSQLKFVRDCEMLGAAASCTAARENMVYQIDTLKESVPEAVAMLAETTTSPKLLPWEISDQMSALEAEIKDLEANQQMLLQELAHPAAFGSLTPLGKPLYAKASTLGAVDAAVLADFVAKEFVGSKMVLAAAGYDHDLLVQLAERHFGAVPAGQPALAGADKYAGGEARVSADSDLTHFSLAFEGVGWTSDQLVPVCVLNTLMGGGTSFSAGGPGKGMYTRLYTNILNRFPHVQAASVFNAFYNETGIFGVYGAAPPEAVGTLVAATCEELKGMAGKIDPVELDRAKNQLTSSLLMNLESRAVLFEDIGRQTLVYGERVPPESLVKQIASVTVADLNKCAAMMLKTAPSVCVYGDTTAVPRYDLIAKQFA
jgi:processing peptidase subunit alpha